MGKIARTQKSDPLLPGPQDKLFGIQITGSCPGKAGMDVKVGEEPHEFYQTPSRGWCQSSGEFGLVGYSGGEEEIPKKERGGHGIGYQLEF
jgi:hypothetical protein